MDFKLGQLQVAAADLNEVLKLDPPIVTSIEIKGRGAVKAKAEESFIEQLKKDILEVAEGQDPDTKVFDLRADDIPVLKPGTVEVIYSLSEITKARLSVNTKAAGKGKVAGKSKAPAAAGKSKAPAAAGKGKAPSIEGQKRKEFIQNLIDQAKWTKKQILEKVKVKFPNASESGTQTILSDSKNPKYNKFPRLVVENSETRILSFK